MTGVSDIAAMTESGWRDRLRVSIEQSGKSLRSVSIAAGVGAGYVHSILHDGKDPSIDRLLAVCDAVPISALYILLGVEALPEDVEILKALADSPDARSGILAILRAKASA